MKWQTRTISTFVAATVPMDKAGDVNPLLEAANQIGVDASTDEEKEAAQATATGEPTTGSYERFMMTFGSPKKWAGH